MKIPNMPIVFAALLLMQPLAKAEEAPLAYWAKERQPIKAFVRGFSNESGQMRISTDDFKKVFEESLIKRKAVRFEVVKTADEGRIEIGGVIKKYRYSESDPVNSFASPSGLLLDAATTENYAEMEVEFEVLDTKTNKTLWKGKIFAYAEKRMTPAESIPIVYDKISRTFLWKCFGKGR